MTRVVRTKKKATIWSAML